MCAHICIGTVSLYPWKGPLELAKVLAAIEETEYLGDIGKIF